MTLPRFFVASWIWSASLGGIYAGSPATPPPAGPKGILTSTLATGSAYDQLWSVPLLYQNEANPYLQELAIQGQLQTQYAYGSDDDGSYGSGNLDDTCTWGDTDVRRFRLGLRARMFRKFKFHSLIDLYPDLTPRVYKDIAETYITYAPCDAFNLSLGKAELKFTREQEISSREYLTFERSQLVNMFYGGELTGIWAAGKGIAGGWLYELGAYGNDRRDEWTHLTGGTMVLAKIGYNYSAACGADLALAQLHFLHNSQPGFKSPNNLASPRFANALALSNDLTKGRAGLAAECFWGDGAAGQADVAGISIMPTYFLAEKLQLITTLQLAGSSGSNGISLPYRYEGQIDLPPADKTGDTYLAAYGGLNYYLYGHKLKLMSGVKYSHLSGGEEVFSGWTWLAGCRIAF